MRYTVNDNTAYGIYNGFCENDPVMQDLLKCELSILRKLDLSGYISVSECVVRALNRDQEIKTQAMAYYTPYPIHDGWREEYKAAYRIEMENKTAPGVCDIPDELVSRWVHVVASKYLKEQIEELKRMYRRTIEKAERQRQIPTPEVAKQWAESYNNVMNEGGYGYVPHYIDCVEYDHAKSVLAELEAYEE